MIKKFYSFLFIGVLVCSQGCAKTDAMTNYTAPVSVKDFGAKGDGTTNDTKSFKKAVDFCKKNKESLFIPKGTYLLQPSNTTAIKIKKTSVNACIYLENFENFTMYGEQGSILLVDAHKKWTATLNTVIALDNCSSIKLKDINIVGNKASIPPKEITGGMMIQQSDHITVQDIKVNYMGSGIKLIRSSNSKVINCTVYDCQDTGLNFYKGNKNCIALSCSIGGCGDGNASIYGKNERCGFTDCVFTGRTRAKQLAVIESSAQCYIKNCIFDGEDNVACNGPIINRSQFCIVSGNIIKDVQYGMIVRDTDIADAKGIASYGNVLTNNSIFYVHQKIPKQKPRGCWIEYSNNTRVEGNTFYRVQGPQIEFIDRKADEKIISVQNANTVIKNNSFILKNSHLGKDLRASYFSHDQPVVLWNGDYPLRNLNFSDNTVFADFKAKDYLIKLNKVSGSIITQNVFQDPNQSKTIPFFLKLGEGSNNTISHNTAGKIAVVGENKGLKITGNNLSSATSIIELEARIISSLITGNTFSGKSTIQNPELVQTSIIQSNFLLKDTALGLKKRAMKSLDLDSNNNMIKDNITE